MEAFLGINFYFGTMDPGSLNVLGDEGILRMDFHDMKGLICHRQKRLGR